MIRNDHVNGATGERVPQLFTILTLTNRRATLELRGAVGDFFSGKG